MSIKRQSFEESCKEFFIEHDTSIDKIKNELKKMIDDYKDANVDADEKIKELNSMFATIDGKIKNISGEKE